MKQTLFLKLSGPMQSWGTESKLQLRRTDPYPSKSGVLGLLMCAMGVGRDEAPAALPSLVGLEMGVRLDRPGELDWDYHTAGAGFGIRSAEGRVKRTASTKEFETLLSRRQYLLDASFLVALRGDSAVIGKAAEALANPKWPVFLGRKCCVPSEPVFAGCGEHASMTAALESLPFFTDGSFEPGSTEELQAIVEYAPGNRPPATARVVYDVPRSLRNPSHGARWVIPMMVRAPRQRLRGWSRSAAAGGRVDYTSDQWKTIRGERLRFDNDLCVFCKSPAEEVHHITYENAGCERLEDLRSLCRICHDACTQLEYGDGMRERRIDPAVAANRELILAQIKRLMDGRRLGRRRRILEETRAVVVNFTDEPG